MLKMRSSHHRRRAAVISLLASAGMILGFAAPAYAAGSDTGPTGGNAPALNYDIYQAGSNTTFLMMTGLANLFNESPGCDLASASGTEQPLDFGCPGVNDIGGSLSSTNNPSNSTIVGENGFTPFAQENPFNDVLIEEPAEGSSNGIGELEYQGPGHVKVGTVTVQDVTVTPGSATLTATGTAPSSFSGIASGENVYGPDQGIPTGATVSGTPSSTSLTLSAAVSATFNGGAAITESVTFSTGTQTGSRGGNTAPVDAARSSRAPNLGSSGDDEGLNFVAYAMDGVSWLHWTSYNGSATPSSTVSNLSLTQIDEIFTDTLSCTVGGTMYTMNWICVGGTNAPMDVYWAQNGSGTEGTWQNMLGLPSSGNPGTYFPGIAANHVIFENETESITANDGVTHEGAKYAIFFVSAGKYSTVCDPSGGYCGTAPAGFPGGTLQLGDINGIPADPATIAAQLPSSGPVTVSGVTVTSGSAALKVTAPASFPDTVLATDTVSGSCIPAGATLTVVKSATKVKISPIPSSSCSSDSVTFTPPAVFPGDRLLYNVYSDGSNTNIGVTSDPALNVVSEDGFLCKPSTSTDIDPNTGDTYRSEIDSVITSQGFYPLPLGVETGSYTAPSPDSATASYGGNPIPTPAWNELGGSAYNSSNETGSPYFFPSTDTDTDNSAVSGMYTVNGSSVTATAGDPVGYCLVLSTDSAENSGGVS